MTLTLSLPDEVVEKLTKTANEEHVLIDSIVSEGIELVLERRKRALSAGEVPSKRKSSSLETIHALLNNAGFVPPNDEEVQRLKDERRMKK